MGTKARRNNQRQREMEIAALNIPIIRNGQVLAPGSRNYPAQYQEHGRDALRRRTGKPPRVQEGKRKGPSLTAKLAHGLLTPMLNPPISGAMGRDLVPYDPEKLKRDQARVTRDFWDKLRKYIRRVPFVEDAVAAYYCAMDP